MKAETENVVCVYDGKKLLAVIRRDSESGGGIVYMANWATVEQIATLINFKAE